MSVSRNEKGLTLVEVLAALAILGIVFIGIMTIFPQMTLFNAKTETKLDTMNLAREEIANIVAADKWRKVLVASATTPNTGLPDYLENAEVDADMATLGYTLKTDAEMAKLGYTLVTRTVEKATYQKDADYLYEADIYSNCEPFLNTTASIGDPPPSGMCGELEPIKLYRVHLKVFTEIDTAPTTYQLSSETFSFLSYEAVD